MSGQGLVRALVKVHPSFSGVLSPGQLTARRLERGDLARGVGSMARRRPEKQAV